MKVRNRILLLASLLLLVSVGGIGNLMWQLPRIDQGHDLKTVLHFLILLGLFGAGLIFSVLELVRHEIMSPILQLAAQVARLKEREIDGHRLELTGSRDIDLLTRALNDLLDGFEKEENLYRIFAEASPDMIFLLDRDGCVLFGNLNAARQWNYQAEEIIGKRQEELFPPDIAERHKQVIQKIFETGLPISVDVHEKIGERQCWIDVRMIPVRDKDGRVTAVLGISRDISERKQAEEMLRESQQKFKDLVETTNTGYVILDTDGKVLDANAEYVRLTGHRDLNEIRGRSVVEWTADYEKEKNAKAVEECAKKGYVRNLEIDYVDSHGKITPIEINATVVRKDGLPIILTLCRDITEIRQVQDLLQQERATLNSIIDLNPYGIQIFDAEGHYVRSNQAFFNMFQAVPPADYCLFDDPIVKKAGFHEKAHLAIKEGKAHMNPEAWYNPHWLYPELPDKLSCFRSTVFPVMNAEGKMECFVVMFEDITERKKAEKEILELSKFPSENPSPVLRIAKDGEILYSNKPGLELLAHWNVKIGEKAPEKWRCLIKETLESAKPGLQEEEEEEEVKSKIFSIIIAPVVEAGYANLYVRDITERKYAEKALMVSEQNYRTLFDENINGIIVADSETKKFIYVNKSICRMLSYSQEELLRLGLKDIHPEDALDKVRAGFEAQTRGELVLVTVPCVRKDGSVFYADVSAGAMVLNGRLCTVGFFVDVTERLESEKRAAMLANAIETAHHGCLIISEDYKIVFVNDYAISKLGLAPDKLENLDLFSLCADRAQIEDVIETMKITKRWMGEITALKKDGKQFPALVSATALDADNDASGRGGDIILFQDITAQHAMREKLLASERLAVMGRLVADVAHELNNPLAIIIGGTQLVLKQLGGKEPELQNQLERILRNGKRCKMILTNLLGYGRTIAKKSELVNIQELIHEAVDSVSFQYDMSGIETALNCEKLCNVNVAGNRAALLSVFINLVRNARQAIGPKGKLTINLGKQTDDYIRVEISDTGIGMSKEQIENLFKPFVSGWHEFEGSGLGLATSLGIIEAHGGKMTVFSNGIGQGTTFMITLPYSLKEDKIFSE